MKGPRTDRKGQNHILKQWSPILVKVPFPQHQDFFFGSFICHFQPYILSRYSFPNFTFNPQRREQPRLRIASLRNYIFLRHPIILKMTTYRPWSINNAKSMKQLAQIIVAVTLLASRKARRAVSLTANIYLRLVMPITAIMMSPGCKMPHQHCSLGLKVGIKLPDFNMSLRSHYLVQLLSFSCVFRCLLFHPLLNLVVLYNISRFFFNAAFMPSERRLKKRYLFYASSISLKFTAEPWSMPPASWNSFHDFWPTVRYAHSAPRLSDTLVAAGYWHILAFLSYIRVSHPGSTVDCCNLPIYTWFAGQPFFGPARCCLLQ